MIFDKINIPFWKQSIDPLFKDYDPEKVKGKYLLKLPDLKQIEWEDFEKFNSYRKANFIKYSHNNIVANINNFTTGSSFNNQEKKDTIKIIEKKVLDHKIDYPYSMSDLSQKIFRKSFLEYKIPCLYPYESLKSYHGGKSRIYKKGLFKNMYLADIKNAYGSVFMQLPSFYFLDLYKESKKIMDLGIYNIDCDCKQFEYDYLFDHDFKTQKKLINIWVTGKELKNAIKYKLINNLKINKGIYYDQKTDKQRIISPFKKYANYCLKNTNKFNKYLINSLYGKLIQNKKDISYDTENNKVITNINAMGLFNPFIATFITGSIRAKILEYEIKYKSVHTLTDAIICRYKPENKDKIGKLNIKIKGYLINKKIGVYLIKNKKKIKFGMMGYTKPPFTKEELKL